MITNVAWEIMWNEVEKKIWSKAMHAMLAFKFLCLCISDDYNQDMKYKDIPNQLCLVYWMMGFTCNTKWWWALWLLAFEVLLVNSYLLYKHDCKEHQLSVNYNHYESIEAASEAWIDPINYWPTFNCLHLRHLKPAALIRTLGQKRSNALQSIVR